MYLEAELVFVLAAVIEVAVDRHQTWRFFRVDAKHLSYTRPRVH